MTPQEMDYHFVGTYTRYSSKPTQRAVIEIANHDLGWTARVEAVLEYFQIPHTSQFVKLSDVYDTLQLFFTFTNMYNWVGR